MDNSSDVIYAHAFAQYEAGRLEEALDGFRLLCTRNPLEGKYWFGLGACLQESHLYEQALQAWAVTALLKKEDPYPHFHAAECYFSLNQPSEAEKALEEAEPAADASLSHKIQLFRELWNLKRIVCQ